LTDVAKKRENRISEKTNEVESEIRNPKGQLQESLESKSFASLAKMSGDVAGD
jgi:hypothetical protein